MRAWRAFLLVFLLGLLSVVAAAGTDKPANDKDSANAAGTADAKTQAVADRIFYQEARLVENMHKFSPMVETYIQNLKPDPDLGSVPSSDAYFLGRLVLDERGLNEKSFQPQRGVARRLLDRLNDFYKMNYVSLGFMQLVFLNNNFDHDHYELRPLRRQFLGDVRTIVFDVIPKDEKHTHFVGRIWVEDKDYNIVRIVGTYEPRRRNDFFFHFDSWRVNVQPDMWLPAYVYTEETDTKYMFIRRLSMKGQTRIWGYDVKGSGRIDDLASIEIDQDSDIADHSERAANEVNPIRSQHMWEREAEDNVLDKLERSGLLAPEGDVSKVLETVVQNLAATNHLQLDPEVRCRVLLTTPLEAFNVGHTIVVSRGLLDVLPDEAALAMVLAHELAHITLGHQLDTKYAFSDRLMFPDEQTFRRIDVNKSEREESEADKRAVQYLDNSPYKAKLGTAGLFLRALGERSGEMKWLISPHMGDRLARKDGVLRMDAVMQIAPQLKMADTKQIAALPLGSRIKLNPWNDHLEIKKVDAVPIESVRDKMPFEVTAVFPNLVRFNPPTDEVAKADNK